MSRERVLFVHGAGGDARIWEPVIAALPDWIEGHACTLTYFGPEPWPDDGTRFGVTLHNADIRSAARALGESVHLVCWSYAVQVGLFALRAEPDLFASALFYEGARAHHITAEQDLAAFGESAKDIFGKLARAMAADGPDATIPALFGAHYKGMPEDRKAIYHSNARMMPLLFSATESDKITRAELAGITTPVCGAIGTRTEPAFAISTRALVDALPHGQLEFVDGADHFLPEVGPERFARLVQDWLERQRAG